MESDNALQHQTAVFTADTAATAPPAAHCQYYHAAKKRLCNWPCKPGYNYCGNHLFYATGDGEQRVPCPANPKHDVPVSQLKAHLKRCPEAVKAAAARAQPYFCENLNTGAIDPQQALQQLHSKLQQQQQQQRGRGSSSSIFEQDSEAARVAEAACASFLKGTAEQRQAAAVAAGPHWFADLVAKVERAHATLSAAHPLVLQLLGGCDGDPEALFKFSRDLDPLMPFDAKHAAQHASIVGNMEAAGLLCDAARTLYVELGAGKGFLTAWLHQVCGAQDLLLLDRQSNFTKKADRRLRHTRLTRVAVDLKDVALQQLLQLHCSGCVPKDQTEAPLPKPSNKANGGRSSSRKNPSKRSKPTPAAAAEGTLDDLQDSRLVNCSSGGLTCCPSGPRGAQSAVQSSCTEAVQSESDMAAQQQQQQQQVTQQQQQVAPWVVHGKHLCGAATDFALRACCNAITQAGSSSSSSSAAITQPMQPPPPSPAVVDAAANGDACCHNGGSCTSSCCCRSAPGQVPRFLLKGLAIATCCHHRCGWTAYCGKEQLQAFGIDRQEFETMAWLTSWALCGHEAPPGAGGEDGEPQQQQQQQQRRERSNTSIDKQQLHSSSSDGAQAADTAAADNAGSSSTFGSLNLAAATAAAADRVTAAAAAAGITTLDYHPADLLDRDQKIVLGLKCKQLIDMGRCGWILDSLLPAIKQQLAGQQQQEPAGQQQQVGGNLCVTRVAYIDQSVTGENTLLVVGRAAQQ